MQKAREPGNLSASHSGQTPSGRFEMLSGSCEILSGRFEMLSGHCELHSGRCEMISGRCEMLSVFHLSASSSKVHKSGMHSKHYSIVSIGLPNYYHFMFTLIDFFFLKTFSHVSETTLNSIFPENVAVKDLKRYNKWINQSLTQAACVWLNLEEC